MRLLFAHDHRFRPGAGEEMFTPGSFPAQVWDRYLNHFQEIHVVAREGSPVMAGERMGRADHEGVTFEFLANMSTPRQLLFRSKDSEDRMRKAVAAADAVIARLPSEIGLLAIDHAREAGKPYAVEVVGCAWDGTFNYGGLAGRLYAPLSFLRNRRAIASAPLALYVTSSWLQRRYPTKGEIICASDVVLLPMSADALSRRQARLGMLANGGHPVLGTIASLHTRSKGVQTALRALASLRLSGLSLEYRVLGSGSVEPWHQLAVKLGVADLVAFDGTRSAGKGVSAWLDDIDIHLQPSFQEGLPRATIEAMGRGVACIGSTCGGIPELLPPERLHRPGDVEGLRSRIRQLATDPGALAAASRADRETARQFDRATLESRRRDFYGRLRAQAGLEARSANSAGRSET
jgi:glycosyltransferase involved in cell wall biosynthesis